MNNHKPFLLFLFAVSRVFSQPSEPFLPDSTTRALWHFEDSTGTIIHDWVGGNHGVAVGTTVVPGRFGYGRSFNGTSDYISIPSDSAFDFGEYSFKIDVWFKTTAAHGHLIRRGLAPVPGFAISLTNGHIIGQIGNREDSRWPDTLLTVLSDAAFNDNAWHLATLYRDRSVGKLFLYVDDSLATEPVSDPITFPIINARPLTIGRWENDLFPGFFSGSIDEVRISCTEVLYHPAVSIGIQPRALEFGTLVTGTSDTMLLAIVNNGFSDSLRISSITSSNVRFSIVPTVPPIPPHGSARLAVTYLPAIAGRDTGSIVITRNDLRDPVFSVPVSGRAVDLTDRPTITGSVPLNYSQARLVWLRSILDVANNVDPVIEYSIWRRVSVPPMSAANTTITRMRPLSLVSLDPIWEFVETVPAMRFERCAAMVPRFYDSPYSVFIVAAHANSRNIFISAPDSIAQYPLTATEPRPAELVPSEVNLAQNYPNPFNPSTTIKYELPSMVPVRLSVFDVLGHEVLVLVNDKREMGVHEVHFDASGLSSGAYFYRLQAGDAVKIRKLLLLK
jgi:hypothetical protein